MASKKQIGVPGRVINSQSREVIGNVLRFMKEEAVKGHPVIPIEHYKQRVLQATGISDKVYRQIAKDVELIDAGQLMNFTAPSRTRPPNFVEVRIEEPTHVED